MIEPQDRKRLDDLEFDLALERDVLQFEVNLLRRLRRRQCRSRRDCARHPQPVAEPRENDRTLREIRDRQIQMAVRQCDGNYTAAARLLGVDPTTIARHVNRVSKTS